MTVDVRADVFLGSWTALPGTGAGSLRENTPVTISRGRPDNKASLSPASATFTVDNRDNRWTIRNPVGTWYQQLVQNSPIRFSVPSSLAGIPAYMRLETDDASYASTPDTTVSPTLAQAAKTGHATATSVTITLGSPTGGAGQKAGINTLVVVVSAFSTGTNPTVSGVTIGGVADNFAQVATASGSAANEACWVDTACVGGQTSVVVSLTGGSGTVGLNVAVFEVNGLWSFDQTAAKTGTTSTSFSVGPTPALSQSVEFVVGMVTVDSSTATLTGPASGWNNLATIVNSVTALASTLVSWQATASSGAVTYAGTIAPTNPYEGLVVTLKGGGPFDITSGTLSVRVDAKITDWTANHVLIAKWGATGTAWGLWTNPDGTLFFEISDGSNSRGVFSTLPVPYYNARIAIRVDYNIGTKAVTFYTAPTMAGSWTQLGAAGATSLAAPTAAVGQPIQVGAGTTNLAGMFGEVYEAQVLSSGTLIADPVFTSQTIGVSSFADAQGNTWTLNGTAELSGRSYRFHGELAALPKAASPNNANVYVPVQAGGVTRRLSQQENPARSAMYRAYVRLPSTLNLAAYWPAEDNALATQIAPAVGSHAMTSAGLTMASSSAFACSAPIPVMNGATATAIVDPASVAWTDNVIRFLLAVPAGGDSTAAANIAIVTTTGTVATLYLTYNVGSGGELTLAGYNTAGAQLFTSGFGLFNVNGNPMRVSIALRTSGPNITWEIQTVNPGASSVVALSGTLNSATVGSVTSVAFGGGMVTSAMGHFSVQGVWDTLYDLDSASTPSGIPTGALNAWSGETAGNRISRLCAEEGLNCRIIGPPNLSAPMGFQTQQTLMDLLQECETTDQGILFEPRQVLGIGYVCRTGLYNQPVAAAVAFPTTAGPAFSPMSDDSLVVNDVTMTSADGSSWRQVVSTGPMSVAAPPSGVGRFDTEITVNPQFDSALMLLAGWYAHVFTVDEDRYPQIPFQVARGTIPQAVANLDIGSYLQLTGTPAWVPPAPIKQIVVGVQETLGPQPLWGITFNGVPESPYEIAVAGDANLGHAGTAGSTVHANTASGSATMPVDTNTGPLWSTNAGDYPFNVIIAGQVITWSAMSGASNPQTATVSAWGVNGVTKNLVAGQSIRIATPAIAAL